MFIHYNKIKSSHIIKKHSCLFCPDYIEHINDVYLVTAMSTISSLYITRFHIQNSTVFMNVESALGVRNLPNFTKTFHSVFVQLCGGKVPNQLHGCKGPDSQRRRAFAALHFTRTFEFCMFVALKLRISVSMMSSSRHCHVSSTLWKLQKVFSNRVEL